MMMMMVDQLRSVVARHWGRVANTDTMHLREYNFTEPFPGLTTHLRMVGGQRSLVLRGHCWVNWGVSRGVVADTRGGDDRWERSHRRRILNENLLIILSNVRTKAILTSGKI